MMTLRAGRDRRPARTRVFRAGILLAIFVLAGLGAAGVEWLRARWATRYSATAEMILPECWYRGSPEKQVGATPVEPGEVANEILRPATASLRRDLRVVVDMPGGNAIRIVVSLADEDPDAAVRRVNDVVSGYSATLHKRAMSGLLRRTAEIGSAEQHARQQVRGVRKELDGLVGRVVSELAKASTPPPSQPADRAAPDVGPTQPDSGPTKPSSDPEAARSGSDSEAARPSPVPAPPSENPEWAAARKRLEQLQRHRSHLLVDRTPAHPEVLQVDTLIAEAQQRLAALPARAPDPPRPVTQKPSLKVVRSPAPAEAAKQSPAPTASDSPKLAELSQAIQRQRDWMDRVADGLEQSATLDLEAAQRLVRGDDLRVRLAEDADPIGLRLDLGDLLVVALAAGLMAAAGVGMIWTGAAFDPPLTTRRNVERSLAIPVVGTISVERSLGGGQESRPAGTQWKVPYVLGGLAILAVYLVFLLHPLLAR